MVETVCKLTSRAPSWTGGKVGTRPFTCLFTPGPLQHQGQFTTKSSGSTTLSVAQRLWQTLPPPSGGSTHPTVGKIQHLPTLHAHLWHMPSPNRVNWQPKRERRIQLTGDKHARRSEGMMGWGCLGTLGETWHG